MYIVVKWSISRLIMYIDQLNEGLVLLQVPKCFEPVQMFWAIPKIWLHLVPLQRLLCHHKNQFYWMQIMFWSGTICLWLAQCVNKFLVWHKKFGPAQNILGPVKGQGISQFWHHCNFTSYFHKIIILSPT